MAGRTTFAWGAGLLFSTCAFTTAVTVTAVHEVGATQGAHPWAGPSVSGPQSVAAPLSGPLGPVIPSPRVSVGTSPVSPAVPPVAEVTSPAASSRPSTHNALSTVPTVRASTVAPAGLVVTTAPPTHAPPPQIGGGTTAPVTSPTTPTPPTQRGTSGGGTVVAATASVPSLNIYLNANVAYTLWKLEVEASFHSSVVHGGAKHACNQALTSAARKHAAASTARAHDAPSDHHAADDGHSAHAGHHH